MMNQVLIFMFVKSLVNKCMLEFVLRSKKLFMCSFQARKLLSNEFAVVDFPKEIRQATFEFLGHSGDINKIHYCSPDVARVLRDIAPALQRISDKFNGEDLSWNDSPSFDDDDVNSLASVSSSEVQSLPTNKAIASWTPKRKRTKPHQFFSG